MSTGNNKDQKSFEEEFNQLQESVQYAKDISQAAKQGFLRKMMEEAWKEKFGEIPPPSANKKIWHKFYLKFWDRVKISFSHPDNIREEALKHFYKDLKNVKKLNFFQVDKYGTLVAHGRDVAYKIRPARYQDGEKLYYGEKFIGFSKPGHELNKNKKGELTPMTRDDVIKLCQADYSKTLQKDNGNCNY